ncbi:MAG: response regulator [Candidatus Eisenbacteria bacterium]|uniref:Response regulator n=1 Tax=Eiseniibacteriota bacterium TaxID=2212470 RepID=A0A948WD61_UNCEI|nr:response regulator [Candidatus Eisenbacteria bacterium]MBU1948882.1 response regulator [Candidatus Eisenbacteria bacterium]MBU2691553.1 response regulator [Candidatus Eisenbacteria bacterium]
MSSDPTVFVVDDDPDVLRSIKFLVESVGLSVECYKSGQEFMDAYEPARSGCLILDLRMPGLSGLDVQKRLNEFKIQIPIIIVTAHGEVETAVRSMREGAFDFINKPYSKQLLLDRIQQALTKDREARRNSALLDELSNLVAQLSVRERQVMEMVAHGKSNKDIAGALGISPKTVEFHRARLMEKLKVGSLAELVRLAVKIEGSPGPKRGSGE